MGDEPPHDGHDELIERLRATEAALAGPNEPPHGTVHLAAVLDAVEAATPGGAPLHSQLDTVRKWLRVLAEPSAHARFGGSAHVREHVRTQLRLAVAALEDYRRQMP